MTVRDVLTVAAEGGGTVEGAPWWWYAIGAPVLGLVLLILRKVLRLEDWPPGSGKKTEGAKPGPDTAPAQPTQSEKPSGQQTEAVERYDQKMVLIERMLANVEQEQERDRARADRLEQQTERLEQENTELRERLRRRDEEINQLRWMVGYPAAGRPPWQVPPQQGPPPGLPPGAPPVS